MRLLLFILTIALFIASCRKDDLGSTMDGHKAFLVGEWILDSSIFIDHCNDGSKYYLSAEEQGLDYRIIVEETGYISFYQNDTIVDGGYIHFPNGGVKAEKTGTALDPLHYSYVIWIDNDRNRDFWCNGSINSFRTNFTRRIEIGVYPEDCNIYRDYYTRE